MTTTATRSGPLKYAHNERAGICAGVGKGGGGDRGRGRSVAVRLVVVSITNFFLWRVATYCLFNFPHSCPPPTASLRRRSSRTRCSNWRGAPQLAGWSQYPQLQGGRARPARSGLRRHTTVCKCRCQLHPFARARAISTTLALPLLAPDY